MLKYILNKQHEVSIQFNAGTKCIFKSTKKILLLLCKAPKKKKNIFERKWMIFFFQIYIHYSFHNFSIFFSFFFLNKFSGFYLNIYYIENLQFISSMWIKKKRKRKIFCFKCKWEICFEWTFKYCFDCRKHLRQSFSFWFTQHCCEVDKFAYFLLHCTGNKNKRSKQQIQNLIAFN